MDIDLEYSGNELIAVVASRLLEDNKVVFVGAGIPVLSAGLAQRTHAPHLTIVFEGGPVAPELQPGMLPLSPNDPIAGYRAVMIPTQLDVFSLQQRGYVDFGFLGGAQIDKFGNINTTVIGSYGNPSVRLPGSGGANDVASSCVKTIIATRHEKRRFVEKVDFVTSPGYLKGGRSREEAGLIFGGLYKVVTDLAVLGFDKETRCMKLESLHPRVTVETVIKNTGFKPIIPEDVKVTEPPTEEELRVLRELDPHRRYICR